MTLHCSAHKARTESPSQMCMFNKRQVDYNLLLFTPFLTVQVDSRPQVNARLVIINVFLFNKTDINSILKCHCSYTIQMQLVNTYASNSKHYIIYKAIFIINTLISFFSHTIATCKEKPKMLKFKTRFKIYYEF